MKSCNQKEVDYMTQLHIGENIITLRHKKGITQDELAAFLNVTKASVSKWETKQSYPDILLLPQIATYFDICIDELLGYEPQLSKEQIKKLYQELADDFARLPFPDVMAKSRDLVKRYYSCYALLQHICVLWLNHFMLTEKEEQVQILSEIVALCRHIDAQCQDSNLCQDAIALSSIANLQLGNINEVIETLEPLNDPVRLGMKTTSFLIQAYQMINETAKANRYAQMSAYTSLLELVGHSIELMGLHIEEEGFCKETIHRITGVINLYHLDKLHPNVTIQFYYQCALFYCMHEDKEAALQALQNYARCTTILFDQGIQLHGDDYFTTLDQWFDRNVLGTDGVRNERLVWATVFEALDQPQFSVLSEEPEFYQLKQRLQRRKEEQL